MQENYREIKRLPFICTFYTFSTWDIVGQMLHVFMGQLSETSDLNTLYQTRKTKHKKKTRPEEVSSTVVTDRQKDGVKENVGYGEALHLNFSTG